VLRGILVEMQGHEKEKIEQAGLVFILQHQVAHRDYRMAIYLAAECMAGLAFDTEAGDHE
jgi:hypothetical protein